MNERIKELAEQAGLKPCNQRIVSIDIEADTFETEPCWGEFEKFAELIVRECVETCKENLVNDAEARAFGLTYNDAVGDCAIQIKNHFGVE